ncbi:serpin-type proteinase inhibitor 9 [Vairimorpha necatrix]|uniref:Serpin-type proteinase inhibitor 9 n=1 Tax=Vairimorpha necatrix TaxID=6039 RepID=A0AAX4JGG6_9MICR
MYKLHDMMLDISDQVYDQMLQENTNTFVFSPLSIINLFWIYFNVHEKIVKHESPEFVFKDYIQCIKTYNDEFHDLNIEFCNIFESSQWYKKQTEGLVYQDNFVFCNKKLNLISKIKQDIVDTPDLVLKEFEPTLETEHIPNLIVQTVNNKTKWLLNKIPDVCRKNFEIKFLNTVLYTSVWEIPFLTVLDEQNFYINENTTVKLPMMQKIDRMFEYDTVDFLAIGLPLNVYCMNLIAVLPKNGKNLCDIQKFIMGNNRNGLNDIMAKATENTINLTMPKFKIESVLNLASKMKNEPVKKILKENNIDENFINFENIFSNSKNHFEHIAMVDINDHGANDIELEISSDTSESDQVKEIQLNRPFLFYIVENIVLDDEAKRFSSVPIFMGRYSGENIE